jgi:hypothetical protein
VVFTIVPHSPTEGQPTQAIAGLVGVLASAALALWTGNARDNYVLGFFTNAGVRARPVHLAPGTLAGARPDRGLPHGRRTLVARGQAQVPCAPVPHPRVDRAVRRPARRAGPLYLVDNVEALGATRCLMGVPLYALVLVFSWLVVRAVYPSSSRSASDRVISTSR